MGFLATLFGFLFGEKEEPGLDQPGGPRSAEHSPNNPENQSAGWSDYERRFWRKDAQVRQTFGPTKLGPGVPAQIEEPNALGSALGMKTRVWDDNGDEIPPDLWRGPNAPKTPSEGGEY